MKALIFGAGIAVGYVLGARAGRSSYDHLKSTARGIWQDPRVQERVHEAAEVVKDKAPEVQSHVADVLKDAARKASDSVAGVIHHDHPGEKNGGTTAEKSGGKSATQEHEGVPVAADVQSDPALDDTEGTDWSDEGGATPGGPATNTAAQDVRKDSGPRP